jgi:HK97 family phage prohead protease/HK97 family phage major capsid protein
VDKNKLLYLHSSVVKAEPDQNSPTNSVIVVTGYASTTDVDRQGDVVASTAWRSGMSNYLKNPIILAYHDHSKPVGRMVEHRVDEKGLWIKARISNAATDIFNLVRDEILTAFSIGFKIVDAEYDQTKDIFTVKELELHEISVVSVPANQNTLFSLSKSFTEAGEYESFKMQFAPKSESAKGLESSAEAESTTIIKEWNMSPEEIKQVLADTARQAAEDATRAVLAQQEKAQKEKAEKVAQEAELEAKIKAAVAATVETGSTGAERLLAEVEKRFAEQAEQSKSAIAGLESVLKEKAAELEAVQKSKMSFADKNAETTSYADRETAVLLAKSMNRKIEDTKFGRGLIEKAGAHQPTNANVNYWETEVSMNMEAEVRRRLVVAPLVRSINMQSPVMAIPVNPETGHAQWTGTATPYPTTGTGNNNTTAGGTTAGSNRGSPHQLKEVILQSYKVATNEYLAYEEEEDSMIVLMPIIRDAMVRRIARAIDLAYLRGAGGTNADPVKGIATFDASSAVSLISSSTTAVAGSIFAKSNSVAALRALRKDLGLWGLDPSGVVYVVSQDVYYNLLEDTNFQTMDKVGVQATLLTGQIGSIGNSPVLVSGEFAAEATDAVAAVCFAPGNFLVGNQRGLRVDTQELVESQRRVMVASMRVGLQQITTAQGAGVSTLRYVA